MSEQQASSSANAHLSYPSNEPPTAVPVASSSSQYRQLLQDRLYIGNLHHSVDEYTLVQVFSKFGKISQLDFLFHRTGALKGKPRGYAFVQYANKDDALKALTMANNKLLRGRKLVVTYAHQAPLDQDGNSSLLSGSKLRKGITEAGRPTVLSLLKSSGSSGGGSRPEGTKSKIAMMEAKLRQMERTSLTVAASSSTRTPTPLNSSGHRSQSSLLANKPISLGLPSDSLSGQSIFPRHESSRRTSSGHTSPSVLAKSEESKSQPNISSQPGKNIRTMKNSKALQ